MPGAAKRISFTPNVAVSSDLFKLKCTTLFGTPFTKSKLLIFKILIFFDLKLATPVSEETVPPKNRSYQPVLVWTELVCSFTNYHNWLKSKEQFHEKSYKENFKYTIMVQV